MLHRPHDGVGARVLRAGGLSQRVQQREGLAAGDDLARHHAVLRRRWRGRGARGTHHRRVRRPVRDRRGRRDRRRLARAARPGRGAVAAVRRLRVLRRRIRRRRSGAGDHRGHPLVPRPPLGGAVGRLDGAVGRRHPHHAVRQAAARHAGPRRRHAVARGRVRRRHGAVRVVDDPGRSRGRGVGARRCTARRGRDRRAGHGHALRRRPCAPGSSSP